MEPTPRARSSIYDEYFNIQYVDKIKYGFCKTCGKSDNGDFKVTFKMTSHNTTSLRNHLKAAHSDLYKKLITPTESNDKMKKNLESFFKVN